MAVGEYVTAVRNSLISEPILTNTAIIGELTKLTLARSGHSYFSLTDENGSIDCVLFGGNSQFESLSINEGQTIIAIGGIDVYVKTGRMQFKTTKIQPVQSIGELEKARRLLIEKWTNDGTINRERLPIPFIPKKLHIITGEGSAALADMQRLIEDRWPNFGYTIIPVLVQGALAEEQIIKAINYASKKADLIIVGRGGGAPEDLWAFTLESVCKSIIDCEVPVVSAVGHESDLLVSDLISDLRASTPSNAIERVVPKKSDLFTEIELTRDRLDLVLDSIIARQYEILDHLKLKLSSAPMKGIANAKLHHKSIENRMYMAINQSITFQKSRLISIDATINAINPKNVLNRGYSMALNEQGKPVMSAKKIKQGDNLTIVLKDGEVNTEVK